MTRGVVVFGCTVTISPSLQQISLGLLRKDKMLIDQKEAIIKLLYHYHYLR